MTTCVVYRGWMAADSRYSDGSSILTDSTSKIIARPDGATVAGCGYGAQSWAMMNSPLLIKNWGPMGPEFPEDWALDKTMLKKCTLWIHIAGTRILYQSAYGRHCDPLPIDKEPMGMGTGGDFARAACNVLAAETSYTPKQIIKKSVEYAIEMDPNSGGKVQVVRLT